jgi:hypothetical protein
VIPLDKYQKSTSCSVLNLVSDNESIEIHFDSPSVTLQISNVFTFMQKSIYRQKFFLHKNYEVRACELRKCFKIEDNEIHEVIEKKLMSRCLKNTEDLECGRSETDLNKNGTSQDHFESHTFNEDTHLFLFFDQSLTIPNLFLSSLIRFSDFMQFIVKTNKLFLLEKINSLCDYNTWLYLIENHKQIHGFYKSKPDLNESSFYFTLSLFKNQAFEDLLRKDSLRYVVLSNDYQNFIKDLQDKITFPISKTNSVDYKFILNTDSPHYPMIFNCISEILNYNFYFLDPKLFFKQYTQLLAQDPSQLIYLNQGITKIIKNCSFEMIFNEESKDGCSNRSTFYSETDFIFSFFDELHIFIQNLFFLDINVLKLIEGLTKKELSFIMKEFYLNSPFLDLLPLKWISPRMSLAIIKLLNSIILEIECPELALKSKKILKVYYEKGKGTGLSGLILN